MHVVWKMLKVNLLDVAAEEQIDFAFWKIPLGKLQVEDEEEIAPEPKAGSTSG